MADLLANAGDIDAGDILSVANVAVSQGDASITDNGDDTWTITPVADWNGAVELSYDVTDGRANSAATANLTVNPVNDAPTVAGPGALAATDEDTSTTVSLAELLANADDIDAGDILSAVNVVVSQGNASITDNGDDTWTITPAADWNGAVELSYDVTDGIAAMATTANLTVNPVNDAPVARVDMFTGIEGTPVTGNVLADNGNGADSDDAAGLTVVPATLTTTQGGTVNLLADGSFTYNPLALVSGNDTFDYTLVDQSGLTDTATVMIDVEYAPVPDAEKSVVLADDAQPAELRIDAPFDPDGDPLAITVDLLPTNGTVTLANGAAVQSGDALTVTQLTELKFAAKAVTATESSILTYQVSDGQSAVTGTVNLAVTDAAVPVELNLSQNVTFTTSGQTDGAVGTFSDAGTFGRFDFGESHSQVGYHNGSLAFETENWPENDSVRLMASSDGHEFDFLGGEFTLRGYLVDHTGGATGPYSIGDHVNFLGYKDGALVSSSVDYWITSDAVHNIDVNFTDVDTVIMDPHSGTSFWSGKSGSSTTHKYYVADDLQINDKFSGFYDVVLEGDAGEDLLIASDGDDYLNGGGGDDSLFGDAGDDLFVFVDGDGNDTIIDFTAGAGSDDVIDLRGDTTHANLTELLAGASQTGADTELDLGGGDSVTLIGVNLGDLHEDDFVFV